jgi:hypothetical protein
MYARSRPRRKVIFSIRVLSPDRRPLLLENDGFPAHAITKILVEPAKQVMELCGAREEIHGKRNFKLANRRGKELQASIR